MHQYDALFLPLCFPDHIPKDRLCTGFSAYGVLSTDIPVYIPVSFLYCLLLELLHHPFAAVATVLVLPPGKRRYRRSDASR